MTVADDHATNPDAALAARYRQRRLAFLVMLLAATVLPVVALGAWWLWPLLVVPAVLAAPLAGGTGLIAALLGAAIALAASSGHVASAPLFTGFVAIVVVAALGAAHAGMARGVVRGWSAHGSVPAATGLAPRQVFDLIADRDCRRAVETGSPVSVAIMAIPRADSIGRRHGTDVLDDLRGTCTDAVLGVVATSDLVMEDAVGRYVALVAGTADAARELAERMAMATEGVAVRDHDGLRVTAGAVAVGVAEWCDADSGPQSLIERAGVDLARDMMRAGSPRAADEQLTGEFRPVAVADAA